MQKYCLGLWLTLTGLSAAVSAQETEQVEPKLEMPAAEAPASTAAKATKKPTGEATITLQTTVTGNQEQPRVLYILPWQTPLSGDVEFKSLSSQQDEVFGHIEREELRRTLEAEEVLNKTQKP